MVTASILARCRCAGLEIALDGERVVIRGPRRLAALGREAAARRVELRTLLERERTAWAELRRRLARADAVEAAARARGEEPPDDDDPGYWPWADAQPDPPQPGGPWPTETVAIGVTENGGIVSGSLIGRRGREGLHVSDRPSARRDMLEIAPLAVGAREAARIVGVGRSTWLREVSAGRAPRPIKIGRRTLWLVEELRAWLAAGAPSRQRWEEIRKAQGART